MSPRPLSPTVHAALNAYTTGGAVALAEIVHDEACGRRSRTDDRRRELRRQHEGVIATAVRRRLALHTVGVPVVEVHALIDHRDRSSKALVTVRIPLRGHDSVSASWWAGGDETMEAWLERVSAACRLMCPPRLPALPPARRGDG